MTASQRILTTVLFTDIVGSTERAVELGDRRWRELLAQHHGLIRRELARFGGREIDTAGDGFFASFDTPARGVRCACALRDAVRSLGIEIRAGLHTGEVERQETKFTGIAVHIGARVASQAVAGEVLVSGTVRDVLAGAGMQFEDRGLHTLKGVPGEWRLFAVLDAGEDEDELAAASGSLDQIPATRAAWQQRTGASWRLIGACAVGVAALLFLVLLGPKAVSRFSGTRARGANATKAEAVPAALSVFAGTGQAGHVNGASALAQFAAPTGLAVLPAVGVLIGDAGNNRIRLARIDNGLVSDFCGSGTPGYSDGPCATAQFSGPGGVQPGPGGILYVSDAGNLRIRAISPSGMVTTLAGSGVKGDADGEGTAAQFGSVAGISVDERTGVLYVPDTFNNRIRKVAPDGVVTTLAGSGAPGYADGPAALAQFNSPRQALVDANGIVYVVETSSFRIRRITPDGLVSTLAGSGAPGFADGVGAQAQFGANTIVMTVDATTGNLYVLDAGNHRIRKVTPNGVVSTVFQFTDPEQRPLFITIGPGGVLYLTDPTHNRIYKITGIIGR